MTRSPLPVDVRTAVSVTLLALSSGMACGQETPTAPGSTRIERWPEGRKAAFLMMFDDSCPSHVQHAIPELRARDLTGTFYTIPAKGEYRAKKAFWEQEAPTMPGIVYGNHSHTHKAFENEEHAEREMVQANEVILRLFPGKTPRLVSYATPGGVKHAVSAERIQEIAARNHLVVRPTFAGHGAGVQYHTAGSILKDLDKAMADGGLAYVIFHGVGGDWISFPLDQYQMLLDGLVTRRDSVWIADPISVHQYGTQRDTARVDIVSAEADRLRLELHCDADPALYDQPLTLTTQVPATWKTCRVTQGGETVTVPVVDGTVRYNARSGAGGIVVDSVPGA